MGINVGSSRTEYKKIHTRNQKGKATVVQTEGMAPKSRESSLRCRVLYYGSALESCMSTFCSETHDNDRVIAQRTMLPKQAAIVTHNYIIVKTKTTVTKELSRGWRDGRAVESTGCSSRGFGIDNQYAHWGSHTPVIPLPGIWCPPSGLRLYQTHTW